MSQLRLHDICTNTLELAEGFVQVWTPEEWANLKIKPLNAHKFANGIRLIYRKAEHACSQEERRSVG